jgi:protein TonB
MRVPAIVLLAVLVNAVLFGTIQYMVVNRQMRLADTTDFDIANFIRMQEQSREVRSRRDPRAPEKPDAEAQQDLSRLAQASKGGTIGGMSVGIPEIDIAIDTGSGIQIARELTPLVRIPPDYPMRALEKGIQGYVTLRFTVTETGSVTDPEVIAAEPPGYFDRAAIRAILKWKYQPQLVDGKPQSIVSYTRINFEVLEEQE